MHTHGACEGRERLQLPRPKEERHGQSAEEAQELSGHGAGEAGDGAECVAHGGSRRASPDARGGAGHGGHHGVPWRMGLEGSLAFRENLEKKKKRELQKKARHLLPTIGCIAEEMEKIKNWTAKKLQRTK